MIHTVNLKLVRTQLTLSLRVTQLILVLQFIANHDTTFHKLDLSTTNNTEPEHQDPLNNQSGYFLN